MNLKRNKRGVIWEGFVERDGKYYNFIIISEIEEIKNMKGRF